MEWNLHYATTVLDETAGQCGVQQRLLDIMRSHMNTQRLFEPVCVAQTGHHELMSSATSEQTIGKK